MSLPTGLEADRRPTVLVVAERASTRSALSSLVDREPELVLAGAVANLGGAVGMLRRTDPDVVLVESRLLGTAGLGRLPMLAGAAPAAAFFVIGMGDHPAFDAQARAVGAAGYLRLDQAAERLAGAVQAASAGSPPA